MQYEGFIGGAYLLQSIAANCQRCVNLYPQQDESGSGKNKAILLSTPGLTRLQSLGNSPVRATYTTSKGRLFVVAGSNLYELSSTFAILGTYALPNETGTGQVSMTDNGSDMMILTGSNGYWFHLGTGGGIVSMTIDAPGSGYSAGDTFNVIGGTDEALGTVTSVTGGVPTGVSIQSGGGGYTAASGVATSTNFPSTGSGLTVTITVAAADTLTQITDAVFFGGTQCGFIDGYIVFNQPGTQQFWITNLYSTVINPIGFASAEGQPDTLLGLLVDHREIWLFSSTHAEVWYDAGGANFPFAYIQGAYISHGIASAFSAVRLDNTVFWLGQDEFGTGIAWRANGYAPLRVSTFAMEQAWQRYPLKCSDVISWTYQQDGHSFWVLNFPSGDATWVYDAAVGLWHERGYLGTMALNDGQIHRARPNTHCYAFGRHIVGDWQTGCVYGLDPDVYEDDTREIVRLRAAPYINNEKKRIFFSEFELDMQVGEGNPGAVEPVTPPAEPVNPVINLRWSDDGGYSWSNYYPVNFGPSGAYLDRVIWRRLGNSRMRVFEVSTGQNNTNLVLINAYLELVGGSS